MSSGVANSVSFHVAARAEQNLGQWASHSAAMNILYNTNVLQSILRGWRVSSRQPQADRSRAVLTATPSWVGVAPAKVVAESGSRHDPYRVLGFAKAPGGHHAAITK